MDTAPKQTLWSRTFVLLTLVQTMDLLAFHSITPVIAKYTLDLGAAVAASGLAAIHGPYRHKGPAQDKLRDECSSFPERCT